MTKETYEIYGLIAEILGSKQYYPNELEYLGKALNYLAKERTSYEQAEQEAADNGAGPEDNSDRNTPYRD